MKNNIEGERYSLTASIGILGGVGPTAGVDLMAKVIAQTKTKTDQDHLPITLMSYGHLIPDRTEYLIGQISENPAHPIAKVLDALAKAGATVAAIACNTAHVPQIFDETIRLLHKEGNPIKLLNIVEEVIKYIQYYYAADKKIGILSTTGSYKYQLYEQALMQAGLAPISMDEDMQNKLVHPAIYDPNYGIKATSPHVTERAKSQLVEAAVYLSRQGAESIILGCTEIPLAITEQQINGSNTIDANKVLARALITTFESEKLKE